MKMTEREALLIRQHERYRSNVDTIVARPAPLIPCSLCGGEEVSAILLHHPDGALLAICLLCLAWAKEDIKRERSKTTGPPRLIQHWEPGAVVMVPEPTEAEKADLVWELDAGFLAMSRSQETFPQDTGGLSTTDESGGLSVTEEG